MFVIQSDEETCVFAEIENTEVCSNLQMLNILAAVLFSKDVLYTCSFTEHSYTPKNMY